jgi:hypothetical protein
MNNRLENLRKRALSELPSNPTEEQTLDLMAREGIIEPHITVHAKSGKTTPNSSTRWIKWLTCAAVIAIILSLVLRIVGLLRP